MDIELFEDGNGGDIQLNGSDVKTIDGFGNMIYIALFGGNKVSTPIKRIESEQSFDYWGNALLATNNPAIQFNSLTETALNTIPLSSSGRLQIEKAVLADLNFMRSFCEISVSTEIINVDRIKITIVLKELGNQQSKEFIYIWDGTRRDLIGRKPSPYINIIAPYIGVLATGGTITLDGDYKIHTFTSSDNFIVTRGGDVEILQIGAGGGGGIGGLSVFGGGGGGAGEYKYNAALAVVVQTYAVVIGAGGIGATTQGTPGTAGGTTSFGALNAIGGGYGGGSNLASTGTGGNGACGGGGESAGVNPNFGTGTIHYNGGNGATAQAGGGGGGGAGSAGASTTLGAGGVGGDGVLNSISGSAIEYCKGGRGGGSLTPPLAATNYGDGGYGSRLTDGSATDGKQGVVIIKYRYK